MSKETIGQKLRNLRLAKGLPLRKVAAGLDMDVAILSKMERGARPLSKEIVLKLAKIYEHDADELMVLFLSQKIIYEIGEEEMAIQAMQVAEEQVEYLNFTKVSKSTTIKAIADFLKKDKRISMAWIYGSFARGEDNYKSDVDLMVRFNKALKISLFDFADIAYLLEQKTKRRIDLVEEGELKAFALESAENDLIKIYG